MMGNIYVEFNGLPGCGKSTVCREIEKALGSQIPVVLLSEKRAAGPKGKGAFLRRLLLAAVKGRGGIIRDTLLFVMKLPRGTPKRFTCFYSTVLDYLLTLECMDQTENCVFLSDQGVLQHFLSGYYNQRELTGMKEAQRIMKRAALDFAPFMEINLNLEPEISMERMNGRNKKASRLEQLSKEEAARMMMVQDSILARLRQVLCDPNWTMDVNAQESPAMNADLITKRILKRMKESV